MSKPPPPPPPEVVVVVKVPPPLPVDVVAEKEPVPPSELTEAEKVPEPLPPDEALVPLVEMVPLTLLRPSSTRLIATVGDTGLTTVPASKAALSKEVLIATRPKTARAKTLRKDFFMIRQN
jgi:hypothetical protein